MKKVLLTALSVWASFIPVSGQALSENAYKYYDGINNAEISLCDGNLASAYHYYERAITDNWAHPFSTDLLNAFHCAMDTKHYTTAEKFLARILSRGLSTQYIAKHLLPLYGPEDQSRIKQIIARYPNDTMINSIMVEKVKLMADMDQRIRTYFIKLNNTGNYMTDPVVSMDMINGKKLKSLIEQYGFPTEDTVGYINNNPLSGKNIALLFYHFRANQRVDESITRLLDDLFYKAVVNLHYNSKDFISTLNATIGPNVNIVSIGDVKIRFPLSIDVILVEEDSSVHPEYFAPEEELRINKARKLWGLESLDDLRKKVVFSQDQQTKNGPFKKYDLRQGIVAFRDAETKAQAQPEIDKYEKLKRR